MLPEPSMSELLAPAKHSIRERYRITASLSFVRRIGAIKNSSLTSSETPAQRSGRRYEARVGKWLALRAAALGFKLWSHKWLEYQFSHEHSPRRAQPDFVLEDECEGTGYVFEVKQTWVDTTTQLKLYTSLLHELGLNVIPATLCRNLTPNTPQDRIVRDFDDIEAGSIMLVRQ